MTVLHHLAHDHGDINRRVLALGAAFREGAGSTELVDALVELREILFLHFAREEEGLFPFVAETVPELGAQVQAMAVAHDAICGALARMVHLAETTAGADAVAALFERFEASYAQHAASEARLLDRLDGMLDADQRARLAAVVDGL